MEKAPMLLEKSCSKHSSWSRQPQKRLGTMLQVVHVLQTRCSKPFCSEHLLAPPRIRPAELSHNHPYQASSQDIRTFTISVTRIRSSAAALVAVLGA